MARSADAAALVTAPSAVMAQACAGIMDIKGEAACDSEWPARRILSSAVERSRLFSRRAAPGMKPRILPRWSGLRRSFLGLSALQGEGSSLGLLAPAELADGMRARIHLCVAGLYEPFGLSVLEAALSGCALVLGDIPSLRENWDGAADFAEPTTFSAALKK